VKLMESLPLHMIDSVLERTSEVHSGVAPTLGAQPCASIARHWRDRGLRPGDLVLLGLPNSPGLLSHFFGVMAAGGVPALVAPDLPAARWCELASTLNARAALAVRLPANLGELEHLETIDGLRSAVLLPRTEPSAQPGEVILITSGTSGAASGCVFGFESLLLNATRHADSIDQGGADTVLINLPLFFSFTLVAQALASYLRGSQLAISGPPFHPQSYLRSLDKYGVTISSLTPVLVKSLLAYGQAFPRCVRALSVGGAPLAVEDVERLLNLLAGRDLYLTYGLTQAGPRVSTNKVSRACPQRFSSVGLPLAGTKVELEEMADGSGRKQLLVTSGTVMRRRIGLVESRPPNEFRGPGFIATGDAFEQDAEGYLYFQARLSDFLARGDSKVCLATVRRVAGELPFVSRAKTQIIDHHDGTSDFKLLLVADPSGHLTAAEYQVQLARRLRRCELPAQIVVVPEIDQLLEYK
jgi:long-chain acyl-CoA synthetase